MAVPVCKSLNCANLAHLTCPHCKAGYCNYHLPFTMHVCEKKENNRYHQPPGIEYVVVPDYEKVCYETHVRTRATMFCLLLHSVAHLCVKYKPTKSYEKYLSDKADVQVSEGVYADGAEMEIDAAHFCNTSFMYSMFLTDIKKPISSSLSIYCAELRRISGATSPQLKSDNVGPDKVIDTYQTAYKNKYLGEVCKSSVIPSGRNLYFDFVLGLDQYITKSKAGSFTNPNSNSFDGGLHAQLVITGLNEMAKLGQIDWALENEFVEIEKKIAALP